MLCGLPRGALSALRRSGPALSLPRWQGRVREKEDERASPSGPGKQKARADVGGGGPQRSLTIVPGLRSRWRPHVGASPAVGPAPWPAPWPRRGPDPGWPTAVGQLPPSWEPLPSPKGGPSALWGQSPALTATLVSWALQEPELVVSLLTTGMRLGKLLGW